MPAKAMHPARLMGATYAAMLSRLQHRGWSPPHVRVRLPTWQKLWIALRLVGMNGERRGVARAMPSTSTSSAPASLACPRRRSDRGGAHRYAAGGRSGGRRPLPLLFRPRTRLARRQWQPPAAVRQSRQLRLSRHRSVRGRRLLMPDEPMFPFIETGTGLRWTLRPNRGRIPWWVLLPSRRTPGTRASDHLALLRLRRVAGDAVVAASLRHDPFYHRLIEPLAIAALNTPLDIALARSLVAVMQRDAVHGRHGLHPGGAARGSLGKPGRSGDLVAAGTWRNRAVQPPRRRFANRGAAGSLRSRRRMVPCRWNPSCWPSPLGGAGPASRPRFPDEYQSILNIHFRIEADRVPPGFVGIIGGTAEWVFVKPGYVSVTISAANQWSKTARRVDRAGGLAGRACVRWTCEGPMPPWRVVKETRATIAATAGAGTAAARGSRTRFANLALAGDWTATGLPATIEGAIRSGRAAAEVLLAA